MLKRTVAANELVLFLFIIITILLIKSIFLLCVKNNYFSVLKIVILPGYTYWKWENQIICPIIHSTNIITNFRRVIKKNPNNSYGFMVQNNESILEMQWNKIT